jgi:hypothetical protein
MIAAIGLSGCTIKVEPLKPSKPVRKHKTSKHVTKKRAKLTKAIPTSARNDATFDLDWLDRYRQMESERGNYTIPKDADIRTDEHGRVYAPREVINHYHDMLMAPPPMASPTP